jgi:hypothetical protein
LVVPFALCLNAQENARPLPEVIYHQGPVYPPLARQARIMGPVHLQITTDGHAVTDVVVKDGHPLLVKAATDSARTWKFVDHAPGTFDVTFRFGELDGSKIRFLQQPGIVDIAVIGPRDNQDKLAYTLPAPWVAQLKSARGNIEVPFSVWTYGPWLQGYVLGPANQRRAIRNTHQDTDFIGFDATVDDPYGQRLKFSLIGKRTGDKIKGIFLDYWGISGTWTAESGARSTSEKIDALPAGAEGNAIALPEVTGHREPTYDWLPFEARIQGQVRLRATTNGVRVVKVVRESGDALLADAAEANVRTWQFNYHTPGTFEATFNYRLLDPGVTFLEEPGVVEVAELVPLINAHPDVNLPADEWKAQFTSTRGDMEATFVLSPFYDWWIGGAVVDSRGKKEQIRQGHHDGDALGFDATLSTPNGKTIKVSVIGKKTGNRMKGVFLDSSGTTGTWTAVLETPLNSQ